MWCTSGGITRVTPIGNSASVAHIAVGGGWTTSITLVNGGKAPATATLNLYDNGGVPLKSMLSFPQGGSTDLTSSTVSLTLDVGAVAVIQALGGVSDGTQVGSALLQTDGDVTGFGIFQQNSQNQIQEAVVPLETRTPGSFLLAFDNTSGYVTGAALSNLGREAATISVTIRDAAGGVLSRPSITLPSMGHTSFSVPTNYAVTDKIRGTIEFATPAGGHISVLGLRFNPTGGFSSVPVSAK